MSLLVTGGKGFIGSELCNLLRKKGYIFRYSSRDREDLSKDHFYVSDISSGTDWEEGLIGIKAVIHLAAKAHEKNSKKDDVESYRVVNTEGSLNLARQAAEAGVKRFIYISSIGVNGSTNSDDFSSSSNPNPTEQYAISKYEAELGLKRICKDSGMELVIVRPPLVFGRNAPGNFGLLVKVATCGIPLPFSGINNMRSFVSVWNLVDLIVECVTNANAPTNTFLVEDDERVSTSDLLKRISINSNKKLYLFYLPKFIIRFCFIILNKKNAYNKIYGSLTVDDSFTRNTLDWKPPLTFEQGLSRSVDS